MKKYIRTGLWVSVFVSAFILYTCEGETECGCDGKKVFNLTNEIGQIYYQNGYGSFVSTTLGTQFELCNTGEFADTLATFEVGGLAYITGKAHNKCYHNPYAPRSYHLTIEKIIEYKIDD